jgi:prohibitin 2
VSLTSRYTKTIPGRGGPEVFNPIALIRDLGLLIVGLIILSVIWPFYSVPTGSRGVVTQFGKIQRIEGEGLAILWPWQRMNLFSIRAEAANEKDAEGGTSDQQSVLTSLTVRYNILPDKVSYVFEHFSRDGDLSSYVQTGTGEVFKAVTAKYTAPELISKRSQVSLDIYRLLGEKLDKYGAQVINVDMTNFKWADQKYAAAISEKVTQDQLKQAADNQLATVRSQQQQKVAIAEAEADALRKTADGNAYSIKANAEASADAIKLQGAAITLNPQILELRRIEVQMAYAKQWKGEVPATMYGSAPIPFVQGK